MKLPVIKLSRDQMMKRVARFKDLKGNDGGLPDSNIPGSQRTLYNVIGFQPPDGEGEVHSPVGADAARLAAIPISEGFNLGYGRMKANHGPLMHVHDTNETFIPLNGRWRFTWDDDNPQFVDLGPYDVISFPPGLERRFECIEAGEPDGTALIMFVIGGNQPEAEFTPKALKRCEELSGKAAA